MSEPDILAELEMDAARMESVVHNILGLRRVRTFRALLMLAKRERAAYGDQVLDELRAAWAKPADNEGEW